MSKDEIPLAKNPIRRAAGVTWARNRAALIITRGDARGHNRIAGLTIEQTRRACCARCVESAGVGIVANISDFAESAGVGIVANISAFAGAAHLVSVVGAGNGVHLAIGYGRAGVTGLGSV